MPSLQLPRRWSPVVFAIILTLSGLPGAAPPRASAATLPPGFTETITLSGLTQPTNIEFSPDGRVFVAEKSGLIKVFDSISDPSPTLFADLSTNTYNLWDRGMLGLALDPGFPAEPWVYVLYAYDADIGGTAPKWGTPGVLSDPCPNPPGVTADGCVVSGRLSRLQAAGNVATGPEQVLVEDWCQQYPSHSVGDLGFGADGALYVSGGDGASFNFTDYGQDGSPLNPCGDPPGGVGAVLSPPTAEGGALRSQDLRSTADPVGLNGAILRLDPETGAAMPGNPLIANPDPNAQRIIGFGTRNPFRMTMRPGTSDLWVGDVGWSSWEEINRISSAGAPVENFGWPCYEGPGRQSGFDAADLNLCENLYAQGAGAITAPFFPYSHSDRVVTGETCPSGSSSISGLAFYEGGDYPVEYADALFFADYSRDCIWAMRAGANGLPDPTSRLTFAAAAAGPVDLEIGPTGDLFYVDLDGGTVRRIAYSSTNQPPTAQIVATPTSGSAPLTVALNGSTSSDPNGDTLSYAWDLDNDGAHDDAFTAATSRTFTSAGVHTVRLRVNDGNGGFGETSQQILVDATAPVAVIDTPANGATWRVGDLIPFTGHATDAEQGSLPASSLTWSLVMHHCPSNCHLHPIQTFPGVSSGQFSAPDHEYPSFLELRLTATDSTGLSDTASIQLDPRTVNLTMQTNPTGLALVVGGTSVTTPAVQTVIEGSTNSISAPTPQTLNGSAYGFVSWSDGGARTHDIVANTSATYTATYTPLGQTITLNPTDDAQISQASPGSNYGNTTTLRVRNSATPGGSYRSYLKFNVTGLSGPPARARLRLFVADPAADGGRLYTVGTTWSESTITWNNAPAVSGSPVAGLGNVALNMWVELDVTSRIGGSGTYAFAIADGIDNSAIYSSSEGANPPQLIIEPGGGGPAPPTANFTASPTSGTAPLDVAFTDTSTGSPTSWAWDFDNNGTTDSSEQNPHHIYTSPGTYGVKLTATNAGGSDTETKLGLITVTSGGPTPPTANFTASPTSGVAPLQVAFTDTSTGAPTSWAWDFDNNGTTDSTAQHPQHIYTSPGTYGVKLTATNAGGSDTETKLGLITVTTAGQTVTLTPTDDAQISQASPGSNYGNASTLRVRASATAGGSYRSYLRFTVSGVSGQPLDARLRLFVTDASPSGGGVYPLTASWTEPTITWNNAPPITGSSLGSLGNAVVGTWVEVNVTSVVLGNGTYTFAIKDGVDNSTIYSSSEGANPPQLVITAGPGGPTGPTAEFTATPTTGAGPLDVAFSDQSTESPTSWAWDFDNDGITDSTVQNPHHLYSTPGTYSVRLTVANASGSDDALKTSFVTVNTETVLIGAGDIGRCGSSVDEATAAILAGVGGTVFTTGDNAYPTGSATDFTNCYHPSWGQHKVRTMPAVGDDDYLTPGAAGYFGYFGAAAGDPSQGYYSYNRGAWHIVVLNSVCAQVGGCAAGSPQEQWLRADLAANASADVLAYFHHPRFSSGTSEGPQPQVSALWDALYEFGADVVVNSNEHNYERFAPQSPTGAADPNFGIRQFVVGTGGGQPTGFGAPAPNSEVRDNTTGGVLKLTLAATGYSWQFLPVAGGTFTDSGTSATHGPPPSGQTITFVPTDDSRTSEEFPTTNYGSDTTLRIRDGGGIDHRGYLRFDVSGLASAPTRVTLRLFVTDSAPNGGALYAVDSAWSESTITWANAPPIAGTALRSIGKANLGVWVEIDLTGHVTADGSYAFAISDGSNNAAHYSSAEGSNPPQLVITTN